MDSTLLKRNPKAAWATIRGAYVGTGASMKLAAGLLGCTPSTLSRWVGILGMRDELAALRGQAVAEGWAAKDGRGKRGPDKAKRTSSRRLKAGRKNGKAGAKARWGIRA